MWYFKSFFFKTNKQPPQKNPVKYLFWGYIVIFKITSIYENNRLPYFPVIPDLTLVNILVYFLVFFIHTCSHAYTHIFTSHFWFSIIALTLLHHELYLFWKRFFENSLHDFKVPIQSPIPGHLSCLQGFFGFYLFIFLLLYKAQWWVSMHSNFYPNSPFPIDS